MMFLVVISLCEFCRCAGDADVFRLYVVQSFAHGKPGHPPLSEILFVWLMSVWFFSRRSYLSTLSGAEGDVFGFSLCVHRLSSDGFFLLFHVDASPRVTLF